MKGGRLFDHQGIFDEVRPPNLRTAAGFKSLASVRLPSGGWRRERKPDQAFAFCRSVVQFRRRLIFSGEGSVLGGWPGGGGAPTPWSRRRASRRPLSPADRRPVKRDRAGGAGRRWRRRGGPAPALSRSVAAPRKAAMVAGAAGSAATPRRKAASRPCRAALSRRPAAGVGPRLRTDHPACATKGPAIGCPICMPLPAFSRAPPPRQVRCGSRQKPAILAAYSDSGKLD